MEVDNEQEQYPHIYLHNFKSVVTLIRYLKLQQTVYIIDAMQKILYHLNEKKKKNNTLTDMNMDLVYNISGISDYRKRMVYSIYCLGTTGYPWVERWGE